MRTVCVCILRCCKSEGENVTLGKRFNLGREDSIFHSENKMAHCQRFL